MDIVLIALLAGLAAVACGGGAWLLLQQRRAARQVRARALGDGGPAGAGGPEGIGDAGRPGAGAAGGASGAGPEGTSDTLLGSLTLLGRAVSGKGASRALSEQLVRSGYHGAAAPALYLGAKLLLFAAGVLVALPLALAAGASFAPAALLVATVACALSFVPNLFVEWKRRQRAAEVRKHLPDAVDMLEICVSAGMGLDAAWTAVTDEIRRVSTVFADEMELTNLELGLGVPRAVAMRHMAARTGADDLSSLVALLVQSERFGAGIVEALTTFARSMRETRSQRAEEAAEKMSVKLLFPMVMFIFPALLIVMVGPAVLELAKVLWAD